MSGPDVRSTGHSILNNFREGAAVDSSRAVSRGSHPGLRAHQSSFPGFASSIACGRHRPYHSEPLPRHRPLSSEVQRHDRDAFQIRCNCQYQLGPIRQREHTVLSPLCTCRCRRSSSFRRWFFPGPAVMLSTGRSKPSLARELLFSRARAHKEGRHRAVLVQRLLQPWSFITSVWQPTALRG